MREPKYLSVDRIENGIAVCEDDRRAVTEIPLADLPKGVKEGSVLREERGEYALDHKEESRRREANYKLFQSLLDKGSEG